MVGSGTEEREKEGGGGKGKREREESEGGWGVGGRERRERGRGKVKRERLKVKIRASQDLNTCLLKFVRCSYHQATGALALTVHSEYFTLQLVKWLLAAATLPPIKCRLKIFLLP